MKKKAEEFDLLEKEGTLQSLPSYKLMAEVMNTENITLNMLPEISKKVKNYEIIKHHYLKYYIHFFDRIKEYTSLKVDHKPTNIISVINEYCKAVPDDNTCVYYQTEGWWVDV
jgi:hypothetical protein